MYIDAIGLLVKHIRNLKADGIVLIEKFKEHNHILIPEEDQKKISHVKPIFVPRVKFIACGSTLSSLLPFLYEASGL